MIKQETINQLFGYLRTFNDGDVSVELYPEAMSGIVSDEYIDYYGLFKNSRIGDKLDGGSLTPEACANYIKEHFKTNWSHYLGVKNAVYNPLWNVDGTETTETTKTYDSRLARDKGTTSTFTQTSADTMSTSRVKPEVVSTDKATFDSPEYNPVDKVTSDGGDTSSTSMSGGRTTSISGTDTDAHTGTDTEVTTLKRGGNIGVVSTISLLTEETDFWSHFDFFKMLFKDVADVLTIPFYEEV